MNTNWVDDSDPRNVLSDVEGYSNAQSHGALKALAIVDPEEMEAVARAFEEGATFTEPITVAIGQNDIDLSPGMMAFLAETIRAVQ